MNLKTIRKRLEIVALCSSLAVFLCGIGTNIFIISKFAVPVFWLLLLVTFVAAALSFPRWKSLLALFLIPVSLVCATGGLPYSYHSTHPSPNGQYQLVVYSRILPLAFPGQGSDAPGYVQLQDRSGRVIGSAYLYMVQFVYGAQWTEDNVQFAVGDYARSIALH